LVPTTTWHLDRPERFVDFRKVTEQTSFELGTGLPGRVLESKKPAWIRDVSEDKNFPRAKLTKDIEAYSGFAMPIFVRKKVVAVLEFFSTRIENPDKELIRVMGHIGTQIGRLVERKQAMESLLQSKVEAEASSRAKTDFLANMSHELRTPLNSIIGFADALRLDQLGVCSDIKCGGYLANIHESGLHLLKIINDILDVSRIDAGEVEPFETRIDIGETFQSCTQMLDQRAGKAASFHIGGHSGRHAGASCR
jgi:signal transduction histidine kinase